jgi:hypothetical protein
MQQAPFIATSPTRSPEPSAFVPIQTLSPASSTRVAGGRPRQHAWHDLVHAPLEPPHPSEADLVAEHVGDALGIDTATEPIGQGVDQLRDAHGRARDEQVPEHGSAQVDGAMDNGHEPKSAPDL